MRRLALLVVLLAAFPLRADAASQRCSGFAPVERSCAFTVTATKGTIEGYFSSMLFTGLAEYAISGTHGSIRGSCLVYPGVATCTESASGFFAAGDELAVAVDVRGAGSWDFLLAY